MSSGKKNIHVLTVETVTEGKIKDSTGKWNATRF